MRISKLLMPAVTVAGALALAGCGGGSSTPAGDPPECPPGTTGTHPDCVPDGDKPDSKPGDSTSLELVRALNDAVADLEKMSGTGKDSALMKAMEAQDKAESVIETQGVSATARTAADEAAGYLAKLREARAAVVKARTDAGKYPSEDEAEAAKKALATADRALRRTGTGSLTAINKAYDTPAKLDKRASDTAILVRNLFYTGDTAENGLEPTAAFGGATNELRRVTATADRGTEWAEGAFGRGSSRGAASMTFAQIFADDLVDVRYGALDKGVLPKGIPVEGESPNVVIAAPTNDGERMADEDGQLFQGIPGIYVFAGDTFPTAAIETSGKFGEGWYFYPTSPDAYYVENAETLNYELAEFVEWGLWLDDSDTSTDGEQARLNLYAGQGVGSGDITANAGWSTGLPDSASDSATYEGAAEGLSARRTGGTDDKPTYASGHFTANVKLEAEFGSGPSLEGTIDGFRGGSHVGGDWKLEFSSNVNNNIATTGTAFEGDPTGAWRVQSYGGANGGQGTRPTGVYGDFIAGFGDGGDVGDGTAAGVFHATSPE